MGYFNVSEYIGRNRKIAAVDEWGTLLFIGLLQIHHTYGSNGIIPANRCDPDSIVLEVPAFRLNSEEIPGLLGNLEDADLASLTDDGAIRLNGYDESFMKTCSTCRKNKVTTPRLATCDACREKRKRRGKPKSEEVRGIPRPTPKPKPKPSTQNARGRAPEGVASQPSRERQNTSGAMRGSGLATQLAQRARDGGAMPQNPTSLTKAIELYLEDGGDAAGFDLILAEAKRVTKSPNGDPTGLLMKWLPDPYHWKGIRDDLLKGGFPRRQHTDTEPEKVGEIAGVLPGSPTPNPGTNP